jgi:hypothetical protein
MARCRHVHFSHSECIPSFDSIRVAGTHDQLPVINLAIKCNKCGAHGIETIELYEPYDRETPLKQWEK